MKPQGLYGMKPQGSPEATPRAINCSGCHAARTRPRLFFQSADLLDLFANLALVILAIESVNTFRDAFKLPKPILCCAVAYLALTIARLIMLVRARSVLDFELRRSVCQVFHRLYEEMFGSTPMEQWTRILERTLDRLYEDKLAE